MASLNELERSGSGSERALPGPIAAALRLYE
jgi:hypothetical protein